MSAQQNQDSSALTAPAAPRNSAVLLVVSAPSGGGKTTVCQHLLTLRPGLTRAITCTTRQPREGEQDGRDYYFLDPTTFDQKVAAGEFLEHATVYGRSYGTLKSEVLGRLRQGNDVILSVDVQGVANIQRAAQADPELQPALVTVFLAPESIAVLEQRLRKRGLDAAAEIERRLGEARQELQHLDRFDYVIISGTIDADVRRMQAILETEKLRQRRVGLPRY